MNNRLLQGILHGAATLLLASSIRAQAADPPAPKPDSGETLTVLLISGYPPYSFVNAAGRPVGWFVDLWTEWSRRSGMPVQFRAVPMGGCLDALRARQGQVLGGFPEAAAAVPGVDFVSPLAPYSVRLFVSQKRPGIDGLSALGGLSLGVVDGEPFSALISGPVPPEQVRVFPGHAELFAAVARGEIEAFVADPVAGAAGLSEHKLAGAFYGVATPLATARFSAAVCGGDATRATLVRRGLALISAEERETIARRWRRPEASEAVAGPGREGVPEVEGVWAPGADGRDTVARGDPGALTQRESDWIDKHPVIRLGFNTDCPPFSRVTRDGELGGIVSDYEFHLSRFIGFPFAIQKQTTENLLELARAGKIDVLATLEDRPELHNDFLFTRPFVVSPLVVVMRADAPYVDNLASLKGKRFVFRGQYPGAYRALIQDYPWMAPDPVSAVEEGLELVRGGQADAYIGIMATVIPALNNIGGNLRVVLSTPYSSRIGFAVRKDWPILVDILDKALGTIPGEERDRIHNAWVSVPRDAFDWRRLTTAALAVLAVAALLIVGFGAWNRLLMREIVFRQKHEMELHQARDAAYAASQAKSMFLANMSHEIRTPLNAIIGFAQILARDPALPRESREQVDTIMRSGEHLLGLINDILEISKIEADRITAESAPFDLHELMHDIEAMFRVRTSAKGIGLHVTLEPGTPRRIVTDVGKVRQILINLIGNAVKFTQAGHVSVRVTCIAGAGRGLLRCEVEDTGPGIPPGDREKIFESFVQGGVTSGIRGGTGLGLTISRRYAKLLGGDIALVRTEPAKGSVFRFEIPFDLAESGAAPADAVRQEVSRARMPDGRPPRVLVVDDESINRRVIVRALETLGFEIREAANGEEALLQFDAWPPDLVLMDIRMPRMDGIQATKTIRARPAGRATPVVALTASAFESDRARILAGGLSGYIRKPFKLPALLDVIKEHIPVAYEHAPVIESGTLAAREEGLARAARWPAPLRAEFRKAAREADVAELEALLERQEDSPAKEAVRRLLDAYDYASLNAALADPPAPGPAQGPP